MFTFVALEKEKKKPEIKQILQASLKQASEKKKASQRLLRGQKLKTKLAIEEPFGLYRPENMKLIQQIFKQEDLHKQHKALLEENVSKSAMPMPARAGLSKLEGKLQAFLNSS